MSLRTWIVIIGAFSIFGLGGCATQQQKRITWGGISVSETGPYVRAEAGSSMPRDANVRDDNPNSAECVMQPAGAGPCSGALNDLGRGRTLGIGVGYRFTEAFRGDLSYNRRSGYNLKGSDAGGTFFDPDVTSDTVMVNGYYDLPLVMNSVRPFIGGGIGRSRNEMDAIHWNDPGCCMGTLTGGKSNDTAWQLTLGADIVLAKSWMLEIFYRYADLGEIRKDRGPDQAGTFGTGVTGSMTGKLRADEFGIAIRLNLR